MRLRLRDGDHGRRATPPAPSQGLCCNAAPSQGRRSHRSRLHRLCAHHRAAMRLRLRDGDHSTTRRPRCWTHWSSCNAAPSQGRRSPMAGAAARTRQAKLQCGSVSGTEITLGGPGLDLQEVVPAAMRLRLRDGDHDHAGPHQGSGHHIGAAMRLRLRDGDHLFRL